MNTPHIVRKAAYSASVDLLHNGHMDIIERAARLVDELFIIVATDPRKTYTFTSQERVDMAREAAAHIPNVTIVSCTGRYTVKYAEELGAQTIIRGLRNATDLEYELALAEGNRQICSGVETLLLPCLPHLAHISSSMMKGHIGADPGWEAQVARSVPASVARKVKEKYSIGKVRRCWEGLTRALGNPKGSEEVFQGIIAAYNEPHRAYHTLEHVVVVLDELEEVHDLLNDPIVTKAAAFYHDKVSDSEAKRHREIIASDEERSAHHAEQDLRQLGAPENFIAKVKNKILATDHKTDTQDTDTHHLLDADLAIFGKPPTVFDRFEQGIRTEFAWATEADYRRVRAGILRTFLERKTIYYTAHFQETYESRARENLTRLIAQLEA